MNKAGIRSASSRAHRATTDVVPLNAIIAAVALVATSDMGAAPATG